MDQSSDWRTDETSEKSLEPMVWRFFFFYSITPNLMKMNDHLSLRLSLRRLLAWFSTSTHRWRENVSRLCNGPVLEKMPLDLITYIECCFFEFGGGGFLSECSEGEKAEVKPISSRLFVRRVEMEEGETDWLFSSSSSAPPPPPPSSWVARPLMLYGVPHGSALILEKKVSSHIWSLLWQFVKIYLVSSAWRQPFRG